MRYIFLVIGKIVALSTVLTSINFISSRSVGILNLAFEICHSLVINQKLLVLEDFFTIDFAKKNFERNVFQSNREGRFFGNLVTDPRKAPMSFVVELDLAGFAILEGNNF